jgi:Tfp pilus assembly protein PilO
MKITSSNRQRLLMILAGAAVALLLLDSLVLTPLTKAWQSRRAEIARLEKNVTEGRGILARADRTRALWAEMQTQALPKDPSKSEQELITAFDRWGRSSNIELGSIKPQWKRGATSRYSQLECRVDATGTLATLGRFLYEVEKSPLALRVDSIELTARDESGNKLTLGLLVSGLRLSPLEGKP